MKKGVDIVPKQASAGFARLLEVCGRLHFSPHDITRELDESGHYDLDLDREFPFNIRLFHFTSQWHTRGPTWHERLELFIPLDDRVRFRMGDHEIQLARGDLLVVDNMKLHHVMDFPGFDTRAVVISFLPEFVYSLGSPSHDYLFLMPFYAKAANQLNVLLADEKTADPVSAAMARVLDCYFDASDRQFHQAGCKAYFLELLYHLTRHFQGTRTIKWEFDRQRQRTSRLQGLLDHIGHHYAEKLSVEEAAFMAHMSQSQFMRAFKKVAGVTLVAYLNHVRLAAAARLLRETALSIAEISAQTGFSDQSYFDKRFKASFGVSPTDYRLGL